MANLDRTISASEQRISKARAPSWIDFQRIGHAYLTRARLTGSYDDYDRAEEALSRGDELAPELSGPKHALVRLNYALHRFDEVEPILQIIERRPMVKAGAQPGMHAIRGDLARQRGELDKAFEYYRKAHHAAPSASTAAQIAYQHFKTGNRRAAQAAYEEAIEHARPADKLTRSWVRLQRGIYALEQGKLDEAEQHFDSANEVLSGWYLVEEHIAEVHARRGEHRQAAQLYEDIVARVPNGEFMDALADVYVEMGQDQKAEKLRARARAAFERDIDRFPRASYGHALGHFLGGENVDRAVELARKNYRVRSNSEAAIKLAQALMRTGEVNEARELVEMALNSPWETAELHATASKLYRHIDQPQKAARHKQRADELNPLAWDDLDWLEPAPAETAAAGK